MRVAIVMGLLLVLTACQSAVEKQEVAKGEELGRGAKLILQQEIVIPAGAGWVAFQDGKMRVKPRKIKQYYPFCLLELRARNETELVLKPDEFVVTRVVNSHEGATGYDVRNYYTRMWLRSERQPQVEKMTCQQWNVFPDDNYVTVAQVRAALAGSFVLELGD